MGTINWNKALLVLMKDILPRIDGVYELQHILTTLDRMGHRWKLENETLGYTLHDQSLGKVVYIPEPDNSIAGWGNNTCEAIYKLLNP